MRPPSLRIAVLGAGKIGSAFAFRLASAGHVVSVVARPDSARLQQLQRDGAIVDVAGARASVEVADTQDGRRAYDLVIVTVLAHQVEAILADLRGSAAKNVLFMFNTFEPERLVEAVGAERCAFGMPFVQATLDGEGRLKAVIGAGGQKTLLGGRCWVDLFNAAGLPAAFEPDMPLWLRCHAPLCVAFESVSVAGQRRGGGAAWGEAIVLARGVKASFRLIEGLGFRVYPSSKQRLARAPVTVVAAMLWGMSRIRSFRELLATGKAEAQALVDAMAAAAPRETAPRALADIEAMRPV